MGPTTVCLSNNEIWSEFRRWLHTYLVKCIVTKQLRASSVNLFHTMVSGAMDLFAMDFGKLISTTMRGQIFGSKEVIYQAYVCALFTAAAEATKVNPGWEIEVERYSGIGPDHPADEREQRNN